MCLSFGSPAMLLISSTQTPLSPNSDSSDLFGGGEEGRGRPVEVLEASFALNEFFCFSVMLVFDQT